MMQFFFFATSPIYGTMNAGVTRIGGHLGAGRPVVAQCVARVVSGVLAVLIAINAVVLVSAHRQLGRIFSDDPQVIENFSSVAGLAAVAYLVLFFFYYSIVRGCSFLLGVSQRSRLTMVFFVE